MEVCFLSLLDVGGGGCGFGVGVGVCFYVGIWLKHGSMSYTTAF